MLGAPRSDTNTNADAGSCSRLRRRNILSSLPLSGCVPGLPFLTRLTCSSPRSKSTASHFNRVTSAVRSPCRNGIAQMMAFGSYVAAAAEISVSNGNKITVHRIVAATDCGTAVNPAQIDRQIAGSFVYG